MDIDIENLSAEEKNALLQRLMYDPDTQPYIQAKFTQKIENVLKRLDNQLEEYFKEENDEAERICRNLWKTTEEGLILTGIGRACARIKRILTEIKETKFDEVYCDDVYKDIHEAKNRIMDNKLSQKARGSRAYHHILKYEGMIADILEHTWSYVFHLGTLCRTRVLTEEEIEKLDKEERQMAYDLSGGCYDKGKILKHIVDYLYGSKEDREIEQIKNLIPLNPADHPDVMDFLKKL